MFYEEKIIEQQPIPPITKEIGSAIHEYFRQGISVTDTFKANGFYMEHCVEVKNEIERIEQELDSIMNSDNKPKSESELKSLVSSKIVDSNVVVNDYMDYKLVYEENTTREDFIAQF